MTQTIDETLAERGSRYGEFVDHADITQNIKAAMALGQNWDSLDNDQRECLEMVAHKVGRILNGDPDYIDSWTDIIGYTRLVEKRLIAEQTPKEPTTKQVEAEKAQAASLAGFLDGLLSAAKAEKAEADAKACTCIKCRPDVHAALDLLIKAGVVSPAD